MINQNKINVIIKQIDSTDFDVTISHKTINKNYHLEFIRKIIDKYKFRKQKNIINKNSV